MILCSSDSVSGEPSGSYVPLNQCQESPSGSYVLLTQCQESPS